MTLDWPFWIAGACLGGFVPLFALVSGKLLGISSGYSELCALGKPAGPERWKLWFALGLPLGGLAASAIAGTHELATKAVPVSEALGIGDTATFALLVAGGALIGYGSRTAGGCTSGHSIVGLALGAKSSLVATLGFMAGGFAATWALVVLLGGAA